MTVRLSLTFVSGGIRVCVQHIAATQFLARDVYGTGL
jgi:hypothetical protein